MVYCKDMPLLFNQAFTQLEVPVKWVYAHVPLLRDFRYLVLILQRDVRRLFAIFRAVVSREDIEYQTLKVVIAVVQLRLGSLV